MTARTSPEHSDGRGTARTRVAVIDDRLMVASGLRAGLAVYRGVSVIDVTDVKLGDYVVVGQRAEPYLPPSGVRVLDLDTDRSLVAFVRLLTNDTVPTRRPKRGRPLSKREAAILSMTAGGSSAAEIAVRLGVSARTVERHRSSLTQKLAARSSSHAVAVGALGDDVRRTG